jgi:cytochrome c peroxidase
MYTWIDNGCGKIVVGQNTQHCTVCHESFRSTDAGDAHRIGSFDDADAANPRRCRTPAELEELSYRRDDHGRWYEPMDDAARGRFEAIRGEDA